MNYNKIIKLVKETNKFIVRSEQLNLIKKKSEADFVTDVDIKISNFLSIKLDMNFDYLFRSSYMPV